MPLLDVSGDSSGGRKPTADESLLIRVAADRSEEAFSDLYDRFSGKVYTLLLQILQREEDAQDILQEVFIQIWNKAPMYLESRGNVAAWILSIARNRAVDELRSKRYRERQMESELVVSEDRPNMLSLLEADTTPESDFSLKETSHHVVRALRSLSTDQRTVVDLAYFQGYTHSEISRELQMPMGSVKTKLRQAMIKMARVLKPRL